MNYKFNRTNGYIYLFIYLFQEFSLIIENIFRNSERRVDVDKWYTRLVRAMFEVIPRIALENSKIPADVIKMGKLSFCQHISEISIRFNDFNFRSIR